MEKIFDAKLTEDGFGAKVVARGDVSASNWVAALNSSIELTVDLKAPGVDWQEVMSDSVGLAYEDFYEIAGTGVGFKLGEIEQTGDRSGKCKFKLKAKLAGSKTTLDEKTIKFSI